MARPRTCIFCGGRPVTREHVFREAWEPHFADAVPAVALYTQRRLGVPQRFRQETPFQEVVRRVCADCNAGWMNELDTFVQPTILADDLQVIAAEDIPVWRRWAVKVAIMRACMDEDVTEFMPAADLRAVKEGAPLPVWRVFIGRGTARSLLHAWVGMAIQPEEGVSVVEEGADGFPPGVQQTSWALGRTIVVAVRTVTPTPMIKTLGHGFIELFLAANEAQGRPLLELPAGGAPDHDLVFTDAPRIRPHLLPSLYWLFLASAED